MHRHQKKFPSPFSVFAALQSPTRVLIVRDPGDPESTFPGGRAAFNESIIRAAARKVKEEIGTELDPRSFKVIARDEQRGKKAHFLVSARVSEAFMDSLPRLGPAGHMLSACKRELLEKINLGAHIIELIRNVSVNNERARAG